MLHLPAPQPHMPIRSLPMSKRNIHIHHGMTKAEFVEMRNKRDAGLSMPKLILPSIQINMKAGQFPEPEENGVSYLKLPLNYFK